MKRLIVIYIIFILGFITFSCGDSKIKVNISQINTTQKQVLFFSLKKNFALNPLRIVWQKTWLNLKKKYSNKVYFYQFQYNHSPFVINNKSPKGFLVIINGDNNDEIKTIQNLILQKITLAVLNLQSSFNLFPVSNQNDFLSYPKMSIVFEQRKISFMKISKNSKKSIIESEEKKIMNRLGEVAINSNWNKNGGKYQVIRFYGYPKEKSWGSFTWDGYIFRALTKLKTIQSISAEKVDLATF